jgi:arylsulfatase A
MRLHHIQRSSTLKYLKALLLIALLSCPRVAAEKHAPNIVIILVDDMGYGDPGCYNPQSKIPTPHIDSLAREGMRFTDAHSPGPLCHPSRYGLMTGRFAFRTDVSVWPKQPLINDGQVTIASFLKSQGYRTAMVGKWHLGFRENGYDKPLPGGPLDCGFDSYFGMRASTDIPPYFYIRGDCAVRPPTDFIQEEFSGNWSRIQGRRRLEGGIAPGMKLEEVLPRFTSEAVKVVARLKAEMKRIVDAGRSRPVTKNEVLRPYDGPSVSGVDTTTLTGKVMCGYQGWFNCEGDGADLGWTHWARNRRRLFSPGNITVDLWTNAL